MKPLNNPESCFVCRRRADGLGVGGDNAIGWLCQICADQGHGAKALDMPTPEFDRYEIAALAAAGDRAGAYLDSLTRTDLATLHPEEWTHVCRLIVTGFGDAIRREVAGAVVRDGFGKVTHAALELPVEMSHAQITAQEIEEESD